jgi:hypothetical protein
LNADFNGAEGTLIVWARVANAGVWTDASNRTGVLLQVDGNNRIAIRKTVANDTIQLFRIASGTVKSVTDVSITDTLFHAWGITWSVADDEVIAYVGGIQSGAVLNGIDNFVGNLHANNTVIGSTNAVAVEVWSGNLAHVQLRSVALSPAQMLHLGVL